MNSALQPSAGATITYLTPRNEDGEEAALRGHLYDILARRQLSAVFQPIVHMRSGEIIAYEGLVRGPSDSALHSPLNLFKAARANGLTVQVERLCSKVVLERFAELTLPGKLFLNVNPENLLQRDARHGETLDVVRQIGINPARVIIELTESQPTCDYAQMREAVLRYRQMGFQIAIDDLGEGFSSLRLWSELRPEYAKIDMHFIQGINHDPVKLQFVRSIQEIAEKSNTLVIAEGIETRPELLALRDIGVAYGQGYHLGRPQPAPLRTAPGEVVQALARHHDQHAVSIHKLLREVPAVPSSMSNDEVYEIFQRDPKLMSIPVADHGQPQGLINRCNMTERFARPGERELYGRKACAHFMDRTPLVADRNTSLRELSHRIAKAEAHHLLNGFIITEQGRYLGMGTGHDLMREISEMHIHAANMAAPSARITSA